MCILYTLLKVVSYYDLSVLSGMSEMGFQKKTSWVGRVLSSFILDLFNFAKPLMPHCKYQCNVLFISSV